MKRSGRGMVEIIVVAAIILVGVIVWVNGGLPGMGGKSNPRPDGQGETIVGRSLANAKDDVCLNHLKQIRMQVSIQTDPVDETKPASMDEIQISDDFKKCPLGGEPYVYDPAAGTVKCPHRGHENY